MHINPFSISSLLLALTTVLIILISLIYGRKTKLLKLSIIFNCVIFIWGIGGFLFSQSKTESTIYFWMKIAASGVILSPVLYLHIVHVLCNIKNKIFLVISYSIGILFILANLSGRLTNRIQLIAGDLYYPLAGNRLYPLLFVCWIIIILFANYNLFKAFKLSKGIARNQILYFLLATAVGFFGGILNFLPIFGLRVYPYSNFLVSAYCLIISYAIIRYRLMDINIAITRGAILGLVYTLVLGIPFGLTGWAKNWLMGALGQNWIWVPMAVLLLFATSGPFMYMYLQRKALNRILAEEKHAHNLLLKASQGMTQVRNLKQLLGLIVHFISKILKTANTQIFLLDENLNLYALKASRFLKNANILNFSSNTALIDYLRVEREPLVAEEIKSLVSTNEKFKKIENQMSGLNSSVVIPCLIEEKLLGFLALGDKKSNRMYTQDDLNVLTTLANQAALAIENAQFYEEVKRTQEQLFQAEKMATIGTMADGLSHQINNRFNALGLIAGDTLDTIKLIDKTNTAPEINETFKQIQNALQKIEDNVKTGGEIVRGLLKYSRPGEEGLELTSLDDVINASLDMAQYKVKLSEIDIIKNYDLSLPKIKMNSTQIQEVFFNLIDNAFFAIKQRKDELKEEGFKGEINISAEEVDGKLRIEVSDNGMGVKKEDFEKLFTPFFTTKASSKKGTGLGLFVIQKIITDTHKGRISVASKYKEGTTFTIALPIN